MRNPLKDLLKTLAEERYPGKITRHDHFGHLRDIENALNSVLEDLAVEERRRYTESCFGHFLRMQHNMKFSAGIVHRLLIRELHHDWPEDEMRFLLGKHSVRFSKRYFEGRDEVEFGELRDVVRTGGFAEQYDAVKLCLLYMLNWILMGLDEREKVPLWQFRLIKNLDAFDAFPEIELSPRILKWELSQRPKGDKLDSIFIERMFARVKLVPTPVGLAERYYKGIEEGGSLYDGDADVEHRTTVEPNDTEGPYSRPSDTEYPHSGPSDTDGSEVEGRSRSPVRHRRVRFVFPTEPRPEGHSRRGVGGQPEDRRYTELLDAFRELRDEVQRNEKKRDQQHQELLDLIRGLQGSTAQTPTEGRRSDDPPFDDPSIDDQDRHFSDRDWTGSHQDGTDLQSGCQLHPSTQTVSDQQGLGVTPREEVTGGTDDIETAHMEIKQVPHKVLPDPVLHPQDLGQSASILRTPLDDPSAAHPSIHSTGIESLRPTAPIGSIPAGLAGDPRFQSPFIHSTPAGSKRGRSPSIQSRRSVDPHGLDRSPPPLQRQDRIRRPDWQERSPYTDPCRPKRARTMPQPPHVWAPHELIDPDHLAAYQAYKRNSTGELRDVDLQLPVDVLWFHRFQSNFMELEDTHIEANLKILRKRQRAFSTVYGPRINILDSQFYSWLCNYWDRKMGYGSDRPRTCWSSQKQNWSDEDLTVVRGQLPLGNLPWHNVDSVLIPCNLGRTHWALASIDLTVGNIYLFDPYRQEVPFSHRKMQLACLRYFVPSMLHAVNFHNHRRRGDQTYSKTTRAFTFYYVSADRVPQQATGGNCGPHTLKLTESLATNRDTFDWSENDMTTIREKMAVEVFCNSKDWSSRL
ncbi:hypothetical protein LWI28_009135 [Acer negundo]|uniref:Ubiquitin-like protease family profile domain-containing protein n=1 Tax=Acer negundo TaxID=4023 RepID=A0AAD5JDU5_ACENE|nr:hypothetical protein LWI28_009135 [Acer negundo]